MAPIRIFTPRQALEHGSEITTWCDCGSRKVDMEDLIRRGYGDIEFPALRRRLFCRRCRSRIRSFQVTPKCDPSTGLPIPPGCR